jgi:hypothetical protein
MSLTKKLKFTEEQKKEYKKLRIICGAVGFVGLLITAIFYIFGYRDYADLTVSITLAFLVIYAYRKYGKILSKTKVTRTYSEFQQKMYAYALIFSIPYIALLCFLVYYLLWYQTEFLAKNIIWLIVLMILPGVIAGILVSYYEKKKFGALMRAP